MSRGEAVGENGLSIVVRGMMADRTFPMGVSVATSYIRSAASERLFALSATVHGASGDWG